jgi:hypothetical protein
MDRRAKAAATFTPVLQALADLPGSPSTLVAFCKIALYFVNTSVS